jgi:SAM-dependent methyltransferase
MIPVPRELLRRNVSPQTFHQVRSPWWYVGFYWPRRSFSFAIRRPPKVEGFPLGRPSELVDQLRPVNAFAPTSMCRTMTKYGSDKGRFCHNYTTIYSELFCRVRDRPLRIFELGLGSNNAAFAFNMGVTGKPGASLRGWRELFPRALVFGADIDRDILFEEDRIQTFYCDQLDSAAIKDLWSQPALLQPMDIIIDDGLHTLEANVSFLNESLAHLAPAGVYVIEDIRGDAVRQWHSHLETIYAKRYPNHEFYVPQLLDSVSDGLRHCARRIHNTASFERSLHISAEGRPGKRPGGVGLRRRRKAEYLGRGARLWRLDCTPAYSLWGRRRSGLRRSSLGA